MMLTREQISDSLARAGSLPSFPDVIQQLEAELSKPEPSMGAVARLVEQDPPLAARLLYVASSAYYGRPFKSPSIIQVISRLGLREIRKVIVSAAIIDRYRSFGGADPRRFWAHSMAVALASRAVSGFCSVTVPEVVVDMSFIAGLLHDLGVVVMFHHFAEEYDSLVKVLREQGGTMYQRELDAWGIDHGEVGELLARRWKLPEPICQVIRYHHVPWQCRGEYRQLVQLVHIANFICINQGFSRLEEGFPDSFDHSAWEELGLTLDMVAEIIAKVNIEGKRTGPFMMAYEPGRKDLK